MLHHPVAPLTIEINHSNIKYLIKTLANLQNYFSILSFPWNGKWKAPTQFLSTQIPHPFLRVPEEL